MEKTLVYMANNRNGLLVLRELKKMGFGLEYLILHPRGKGKFVDEIISESSLDEDRILFWNAENLNEMIEKMKNCSSKVLFSVNFGYKVPLEILKIFELPLNLHMGYLPYNKGRNPNVWAIIDGTPAGVSIHRMVEKIDEGEIFARKLVDVKPWDTGKTLYEKLERASVELVREKFIDIIQGNVEPIPNHGGTRHYLKEFKRICKIDPNKNFSAMEFVNLLRALTFPPYRNAHIEINGRKIYLELNLYPEDEEGSNADR